MTNRFVLWVVCGACFVSGGGAAAQTGMSASVLFGPGSATHPAVSPDGAHVAFMSNAPGVEVGSPINFEIYVMELSGRAVQRLTSNLAFDADIAWSPDGRRIAYKSYRDGNDEIYVMNADGSGQSNLTQDPHADHAPHWSPDGTAIAFSSDRLGSRDIFVMRLEEGITQAVTSSAHSESSPRWSPDGRRLAFVSNRAGNDDVYVMDVDGGNLRQLTASSDSDWYPRWSPDGSRILFISGDFSEDRWSLYSVRPDGAEPPTLVLGEVDSGNASWHPDGSCIVFGRYVDGESRLFVARADGSGVTQLGKGDAPHCPDREDQGVRGWQRDAEVPGRREPRTPS